MDAETSTLSQDDTRDRLLKAAHAQFADRGFYGASIAQIAGIMGAKETPRLIPLCHQVQIQGVDVDLSLDEDAKAVSIRAFAKSLGPTGVEMEALTAVSVAALTVYDMCKSITKDIRIENIHLLAKTGGASGDYMRPESLAGETN